MWLLKDFKRFSAMGKIMVFSKRIDQDQTAQNVQSDLVLCHSLVKSDVCDTIICGTRWMILYTVLERGRFKISGTERVKIQIA